MKEILQLCSIVIARPRRERQDEAARPGTAPSTTDNSGLIKNVQISAPLSSTPAVTKNGAIQNPLCAKNPKTTGDTDAANAPAVFITLLTVPLNSPPTSIGTAQAGPITNSRKKNEMARQV